MAQQFSNTSKHEDPYKDANLDTEVSLEQKIKDLSGFMAHCKFGMMTTRDARSGNLVSRCMALAAQVCTPFRDTGRQQVLTDHSIGNRRH